MKSSPYSTFCVAHAKTVLRSSLRSTRLRSQPSAPGPTSLPTTRFRAFRLAPHSYRHYIDNIPLKGVVTIA